MTKKHAGGRPSKLTKTFIDAAKEVLNCNDGEAALIFTDEELLFAINERLEPEQRIGDSTWDNWKAGTQENNEIYGEFLGLIKKALNLQKANLFQRFRTDKNTWQRWAWIIERKFKEWRLPNKHMMGGDPDNPAPITTKNIEVTFGD